MSDRREEARRHLLEALGRCLRALSEFSPRLIGSVSTGHIRRGSDIDLHVFTDDLDPLFDRSTYEDKPWIRNPGCSRIRYECHMFSFFQELYDPLHLRES